MAPASKVTGDSRSAGGKIAKRRRMVSTPYDRPMQNTTPENPNWFRGLISPAKTVAGKLLSSFWNSDTWSSSSLSSSSDSDSLPASVSGSPIVHLVPPTLAEDGVEDYSDQYEIRFDEAELNEYLSPMIKSFSKDSQLAVRNSEVKCMIEQLLVLEKFTRAEADRLIDIINSQVVDIFQKEGSGAVTDIGTSDVRSRAVMEAKKWLEENLKSNSDHALSSIEKDHVKETEVGSPVYVARSYMRDRPIWASPSLQHRENRSPSAVPNGLFTEVSPHLKRASLSAGSWNIQEEIRKLRSKATEDMLRPRQSTKLDLSSFFPEYTTTKTSLVASQAVDLINTTGPSDLGKTQDGTCNEVPLSYKPVVIPEQNQDLSQTVAGEGAAVQSHHDARSEIESEQHLVTGFLGAASNANNGCASQLRSSYDDELGVDGTCHLLTEAFVEVPTNEEIPNLRGGARREEEEEELANRKSDSSVSEKQAAGKKKSSRYVRKGRGRGK